MQPQKNKISSLNLNTLIASIFLNFSQALSEIM